MCITLDKGKRNICSEDNSQSRGICITELGSDELIDSLLKELGIRDIIGSYAKKKKHIGKIVGGVIPKP